MNTIYFDMDGTFYDLYGYNGWLECILSEKTECYTHSKMLVDYDNFISILIQLKEKGYKLGIISWLSKNATKEYQNKVRSAKTRYIKKYFSNIFDEIHIIQYGKNKSQYCKENDILFDDELNNRSNWNEKDTNNNYCHFGKHRYLCAREALYGTSHRELEGRQG